MKRLKFKKPFNGFGNALKLIPESYRVEGKEFEMTDGNETYRMKWEDGNGKITSASDDKLVNEDIDRLKQLMGYDSSITLGLVKGDDRIEENKVFGKSLLKEDDGKPGIEGQEDWEKESQMVDQGVNPEIPPQHMDEEGGEEATYYILYMKTEDYVKYYNGKSTGNKYHEVYITPNYETVEKWTNLFGIEDASFPRKQAWAVYKRMSAESNNNAELN